MSTNNSLMSIKNISKSFQQGEKTIEVLKNLDFSIERGATASIVGKSGSGKSTLLSLLAGLDWPDTGSIEFEGNPYSELTEEQITVLRNGKIGIIFQQFHLISHLTAYENVLLPLEIKGLEKEDHEKVLYYLDKVGLSQRLNHLPGQLSGGEKQRVAIARSLIIKPKMLLADEPSGSLDDQTGDDVMSLIFDLVKEEKTGLILVTHNQQLAKQCQNVWTLASGQLSQ